LHPFFTPQTAQDRQARLRREADDARLAAAARRSRLEAVGAFEGRRLVGAAHYFQLRDTPTRAEIAAEVADRYQRRGIGSTLLHELAKLARARGFTHFGSTVLLENTPALGLLRASGWSNVWSQDGPEVAITTTLPDAVA